MNITKEILDYLNVISVSVGRGRTDIVAYLSRYARGEWTLSLLQKQEFTFGERVAVKINFLSGETEEFTARVKDFGEDFLEVSDFTRNGGKLIKNLFDSLEELNDKYEKFGRRKERRIEIGRRNYQTFGLSSMEQKIFIRGIQMQQSCALVDASVHGLCIITPFSDSRMKDIENFYVLLHFLNPEQTITVQCHKVHMQLKKTESHSYAKISCQLLEPIHFAWKDHVIRLMEQETFIAEKKFL